MILVAVEHLQGKLNKMSLEALAAALAIGKEMNHPVEALVMGGAVAAMAAEIPTVKLHVVENPKLDRYTADGFTAALKQVVEKLNPWLVLLPHTYQARDFAPKLAAGMGKAFVSDGTGYKA
jgi:electron transfer flavoprotein alpha subunit